MPGGRLNRGENIEEVLTGAAHNRHYYHDNCARLERTDSSTIGFDATYNNNLGYLDVTQDQSRQSVILDRNNGKKPGFIHKLKGNLSYNSSYR
eukprot:UN06232